MQFLLVALGGALGAVARYVVLLAGATRSEQASTGLYSTLLVNVLGSLLVGVLYVLIAEKLILGEQYRLFLVVGFLGSFTTFSAYSLESVALIQSAAYGAAFTYIILTVVLCVGACLLAVALTRTLL